MLPVRAGDVRVADSIPGSGRSPGGGHDNLLQYSCLESLHGQRSLEGYSPQVTKSWTWLSNWTELNLPQLSLSLVADVFFFLLSSLPLLCLSLPSFPSSLPLPSFLLLHCLFPFPLCLRPNSLSCLTLLLVFYIILSEEVFKNWTLPTWLHISLPWLYSLFINWILFHSTNFYLIFLLHYLPMSKVYFSSVQLPSPVRLFATPWTTARQASLSITNFKNLLKLMSIELVMPSNHLTLCCSLLPLPSIFPRIRVFSNQSALRIRWPKYWSFSFSISPSNEYSLLISFRTDWLDLLAVQGTLKSLL